MERQGIAPIRVFGMESVSRKENKANKNEQRNKMLRERQMTLNAQNDKKTSEESWATLNCTKLDNFDAACNCDFISQRWYYQRKLSWNLYCRIHQHHLHPYVRQIVLDFKTLLIDRWLFISSSGHYWVRLQIFLYFFQFERRATLKNPGYIWLCSHFTTRVLLIK